MLAIFGFRKKRNQTLSNQATEPEAEVYGDGCHTVATAPTGFVYLHEHTLTLRDPIILQKDMALNIQHNVHVMCQIMI